MTDIDSILLSAQSALARESTHGPLLMRADATDLHDMIRMYRQVRMEREQKATHAVRVVEAERGLAAFDADVTGAVRAEHADVAATLVRLSGGTPGMFEDSSRSPAIVEARVAVTAVFWLAVKWQVQPSWPESARALRSANHSSLISRVNSAPKHMEAIRRLYDAARASGLAMREWNDVVEAVRNR